MFFPLFNGFQCTTLDGVANIAVIGKRQIAQAKTVIDAGVRTRQPSNRRGFQLWVFPLPLLKFGLQSKMTVRVLASIFSSSFVLRFF